MRLIIALAFVFLLTGPASAGTAFTYQGQLEDGGGPVDDTVVMEFFLYDGEAATTPLASDDPRAVTVSEGLFQTAIDFGQQPWGEGLWMEIVIDSATTLPRQTLTGVPLALGVAPGSVSASGIASGAVGSAQIDSSQVQRRVGGSCTAGSAIGGVNEDGTVSCQPMPDDYWATGGNIVDGSQFLGTTNNQPLVLRTAGADSLRIEPSAVTHQGDPATVNIIAGSHANSVADGVRGATIAGGGVPAGFDDPDAGLEDPNQVLSHYGSIGGGYANTAGESSSQIIGMFATVGGGVDNIATRTASTVGGGESNTASGRSSTVGGGESNNATFSFSTIGGGRNNTADGSDSTIGGGTNNTADGRYSTIGGGLDNTASALWSTVGGGVRNTASNDYGTVGGGQLNSASRMHSTVGGGLNNRAIGRNSTVSGGAINTASGNSSTVGGGARNCAGGNFSIALGLKAKVRPGSDPNDGSACAGLSSYSGDSDGDEGTFIWADSADANFTSSGPDQFLIRAGGGVGIGTNSPRNQLDVVRERSGSALNANHVMTVHNTATSQGNVLALQTGADTPGAAENFITFKSGISNVGAIEGDSSGGGVTLKSGSADFAEYLRRIDPDEPIGPGDVVGVIGDAVTLDTDGADRVMVASTRPIVAGNDPGDAPGLREQYVKVAFVGQAPVKIKGAVSRGDFLIPSGNDDGTAIGIAPAGLSLDQVPDIIGRALEGSAGGHGQTVNTLVGLPQPVIVENLLNRRDRRLAVLEDHVDQLGSENERLRQRLAEISGERTSVKALQERLAMLEAILLDNQQLTDSP